MEADFNNTAHFHEPGARLEEVNVDTVEPSHFIDFGRPRPSPRAGASGDWVPQLNGLLIFGGETESELCDPECYLLRFPTSVSFTYIRPII